MQNAREWCLECDSENITEVSYPLMRCRDCGAYFEVDDLEDAKERPVKRFDDDDGE